MKTNKIITALEKQPCITAELPYRITGNSTGLKNRQRIRRIKVGSKRTNKCFRCGRFQTVYYLAGDEDRAVQRFVEVNAAPLSRLNLHTCCTLDSGLSRDMAQRIKAVIR